MDERAALRAGEGQLVQLLGEGCFAKDHAAARAAQRLVRGGGNDVGMRHGTRMDACGDEAGDVGHVHKKEGANGFRGFADALEINDARIGAGAGDDHLWFVLGGKFFDFIVVNAFVFFFHAVGDELVHAAGEIQGMAVRQVAAVGKIHSEDCVVFLQGGHVDGDVRGGAGMRLDVGVFRAEELLGAVDGQLLDFVGVLAATVVALAGIALGIFVGEDGAHGFEDGFGDEVFRGNEFEAGGVAAGFVAEEIGDLRVDGIERAVHAVVGSGGLLAHAMASWCSGSLRPVSGR